MGNRTLSVVAIIFQGCCPLRLQGFNQFVVAGVRSVWGAVYIRGTPFPGPCHRKNSVTHWMTYSPLVRDQFSIPVSLQHSARLECERERHFEKTWLELLCNWSCLLKYYSSHTMQHSAPFILWFCLGVLSLRSCYCRSNLKVTSARSYLMPDMYSIFVKISVKKEHLVLTIGKLKATIVKFICKIHRHLNHFSG